MRTYADIYGRTSTATWRDVKERLKQDIDSYRSDHNDLSDRIADLLREELNKIIAAGH